MVVCCCLCGVAFADIVGSFFDMAVLQRVRAATVVKYVCYTPSLAGDYITVPIPRFDSGS